MKLLSSARDKYRLIPNIYKRILIRLFLLWVYILRERGLERLVDVSTYKKAIKL